MYNHTIDIIVPTYRLDEAVLLNIIHLPKPAGFIVAIYIVSDNPMVVVPGSISQLHEKGTIQLLVNKRNLGAAATRNAGINAGAGKWLLLLDDDIQPREDLLLRYAEAIFQHPDALGFAGVTYFPPPFNAATKALYINGSVGSFTDAERKNSLVWAPTANVMLNRDKIHPARFDPSLINAEDIDFLARNSLQYNEKYISVPAAAVYHPWWGGGKRQTKRMVSYGRGASQIARKKYIKRYTYRDFTNTSETLLVLILCLPVALMAGYGAFLFSAMAAVVLAEFITNWLKAVREGKTTSLATAFEMMWAKNCWEAAFLFQSISTGYINGFAQRIDLSFSKPNPSPFRTNRWKIFKMIVLAVLLLVLVKTL